MEPCVPTLRRLTNDVLQQEAVLREGGGPSGHERQRKLGRLTVRERIAGLLDEDRHSWSWACGPPTECILSGDEFLQRVW